MLNEARLKNAALSRQLTTKQRNVNDHQRLLKILALNDVKRLKCVLGVALKRGCSVAAIIIRVEQAIDGLYNARGNYSERELDIAFLAKSLGGPKLLYALCRSHGLPAYRTITNHRAIPRLLPSGSVPTADEVSSNIASFFCPEQRPLLPRCGHSLLIDGVAVDERGCYNRETNEVVGFCREHSAGVDRRITGMAAIEYLADLVHCEDPSLHFGSEASVVAIAAHRQDHYQAIPLVVSTKCGSETGEHCAVWLRRVITAWESDPYGAACNGPIWSVASDGEASLRNSRFQLCMDHEVQGSSSLGLKLSRLAGINLHTGPGDITMTADYKHAFKHTSLHLNYLSQNSPGLLGFATQIRARDGFQVWDGVCNRHQLLRFLVELRGIPENKACQLLDPADKQNVPKAVALLQAICDLRQIPLDHLPPSEQADLRRFHFLREVISSFLYPFIDVNLSLEQQIISLVKYAHLICICWIRHGNSFMTGALYADTQAIVKNIIFSLAKQQILDSTQNFYIILDGTDRLEQVFSDVRTQDHSRNFDLLQLSQKLATASTINSIFLRNPELNRGHRRLNLTNATGVDHVNPKSCLGNVISGSVNIQALWVTAQNEANKVLVNYFGEQAATDFNKLFRNPKTKADLLRPEGKYVGTSTTDSLAEYEHHDDIDTPQHGANTSDPADITTLDDENEETDETTGMTARAANVNLEDFLSNSPDQPSQSPPATLFIDGPDRKQYYKGSVVASYLRGGHRAKKVVERTLRARGVTLESLREARNPNITDVLSGDNSVIVGDLAATLVRLGQRVCLVVIHIVGFVHKKSRIDRVAMEMLEQRTGDLTVTGEVLEIHPLRCADDPDNSSWAWSLNYLTNSGKTKSSNSKLTVKRSSFSFPAWLIIPLCPTLCDSSLVHNQPPQPFTWAFEEGLLDESLSQLWGLVEEQYPAHLDEALKVLTSLSINELPYRSSDDDEHFFLDNLVTVPHAGIIQQNTKITCLLCCKNYVLGSMRRHIGQHILRHICGEVERNPIELGVEPCGFCGAEGCATKLDRTRNNHVKIISDCRYAFTSFNYEQVKNSTKSSPCMNVPISCPFCLPLQDDHFIWKYNAVVHMATQHPGEKIPLDFLSQIHISLKETESMKVALEGMGLFRETHNVMNSDDLEEVTTGDKRARASSASSVGGARKNSRYQ
ncbi:hypothetical protein BJ322DRAFT_1195332 [Thelephora terrestris]|uniref:Uncharacterized protein n=1 Tax=Thelephora terrestris TaxID=56493 RepID=A0A9P6HDM1_9AGAM|nr:hypothetical protein BJ322DRAFT_1195332 [Thelephora terrestris]